MVLGRGDRAWRNEEEREVILDNSLSLLINAKAISITAGPKRLISDGNRVREASLSETLWPLVVVVKSLGCLV